MLKQLASGLVATIALMTTRLAVAADSPKSSGNDTGKPIVNGESLTDTTRRNGPAEQFGAKKVLAFSSDAALTISNTTISGESGSTTTVNLEPAVDYFVIRNLSIGGFLEFNYTSASSGHGTRFGIGPRVGYNFTFSDLVSLWPKAGFSIESTSSTTDVPSTNTSQSVSSTNFALNIFVPIMFHPAPHFFAGFGPFLDTDLSGDRRATSWGARLTLGGWIGPI